jgi:hypothetical protein
VTRREGSYLLPNLNEADRKLLEELPRKASLVDEIAYLRLRIVRMAEDPDSDPGLLVRTMELLVRMVRVQAKVGPDSGDRLVELTEIVRQRLASGATPEEAVR